MFVKAKDMVPYLDFSLESFGLLQEKGLCFFLFLAYRSKTSSYIIGVNDEFLLIILVYLAFDYGEINGWVIEHNIVVIFSITFDWDSRYPASWIFLTLCKHILKVLLQKLSLN